MKMRKGQDTIDIPEADVSTFVRQGFVPFVADSAPVLRTPASQVRAAQVAPSTGSPAVDFFERGRRTRAQGMPDIDVGGFVDRTLAALHPDVSPDRTSTQNATSAVLNALSAPGRAVAATPSLFGFGPDSTFLDAFARRGASPKQGPFAGFVEDVARDPANVPAAMLAGPAGVASKAILGRLGTTVLPKILAKVVESEIAAGLPMATTGAARQFADGSDDYGAAIAAPVALAPVGEAALKGGKVAFNKGGKAVMNVLDKIKTPGYKPLDQITIDAAAAGEAQPMDRTIGLLTHPTLGGVVRDVRQSISDWLASDAVRNPAATTAKSMLRGMVKPAPMVKKQAESRDWDAALAGPEGTKLFDQLTSYLDVGLTRDATANMASRNLAHIDDANKATWEPLLGAAKSSVRDYEDAVAAARATSDPEIEAGLANILDKPAITYAAPKIGVDPKKVFARAQELAFDEAPEFGLLADKLRGPLNEQYRHYTYDPSTSKVKGTSTYNTEIMDPVTAHKRKAAQMRTAYAAGDPRMSERAQTVQAAAAIFGKAHNQIVDDLLRELQEGTIAHPLPVPRLRTDAQRELFTPGPDGEELITPSKNAFIGDNDNEYMRYAAEDEAEIAKHAADPDYEGVQDFNTLRMGHDAGIGGANTPAAHKAQQDMLSGAAPLDLDALREALTKDDVLRLQLEQEYRKALTGPKTTRTKPAAPPRPVPADRYHPVVADIATEMRGDAAAAKRPGRGYTTEPAFTTADVHTQQTLDRYLREQVGPWLDVFSKYKASADRLPETHAAARALDKTMRPWYQVEAALRRAEARSANKNHYPKLNIPMTLGGSIVGAGTGAWNSDESSTLNDIVKDAITGAVAGAGVGFAATRGGTPAGAKLVRDIGRGSWAALGRPLTKEAAASARRVAPVTATGNVTDVINEVVRDLLKDKRNDGVVPTDSNRLADKRKKGADK